VYTITPATETAFDTLRQLPAERLRAKLLSGEVLVVWCDGAVAGWLRYGYFWDAIPFMNLLYLLEPHRRRGLGTRLVTAWEAAMQSKGYRQVMTSTLSNESAQHFYRKLGYRDLGGFVLPGEALERELARREWPQRLAGRPKSELGVSAASLLAEERAGRDREVP
jgi:GNAT superfamily N-acetyltransferase